MVTVRQLVELLRNLVYPLELWSSLHVEYLRWVCTPYRQPLASKPRNKMFNELYSSARVTIEHVNGILKSRFSSLRGLRIQVNQYLKILCILHNILMKLKDDSEDEHVAEDIDNGNIDRADIQNGNELRNVVQNTLLHLYGYE